MREAAQEGEIELVDDASGVALERGEIRDATERIAHEVRDGRTVHEREGLDERHAARAFALASALPRRLAEEIEEAVGELRAGIDELGGARAGQGPRQCEAEPVARQSAS
jgi:hypothetical protein